MSNKLFSIAKSESFTVKDDTKYIKYLDDSFLIEKANRYKKNRLAKTILFFILKATETFLAFPFLIFIVVLIFRIPELLWSYSRVTF